MVKEFVKVTWEVAMVEFEGWPLLEMPTLFPTLVFTLFAPTASTLIIYHGNDGDECDKTKFPLTEIHLLTVERKLSLYFLSS